MYSSIYIFINKKKKNLRIFSEKLFLPASFDWDRKYFSSTSQRFEFFCLFFFLRVWCRIRSQNIFGKESEILDPQCVWWKKWLRSIDRPSRWIQRDWRKYGFRRIFEGKKMMMGSGPESLGCHFLGCRFCVTVRNGGDKSDFVLNVVCLIWVERSGLLGTFGWAQMWFKIPSPAVWYKMETVRWSLSTGGCLMIKRRWMRVMAISAWLKPWLVWEPDRFDLNR
jgi:hypothetical protein